MAKGSKQSAKAIQQLLDEKRQLERWLKRLDMAADNTAGSVRDKVRGDYAKRLDAVVKELQGYRNELQVALERQEERRDELRRKEADKAEELSEAELRHAVGEYDEGQWAKLRTDIREHLVKLREGLKEAEEEIEHVKEVMTSFAVSLTDDDDARDEGDADVEDVEGLETAPQSGTSADKSRRKSQTDAFDELAFLKSVTEDEEHGPAASRASGGSKAISDRDLHERGAKKIPSGADLGAAGVRSVSEGGERPSKGTAKRTLKCADCGAMNLPTEWYCEKCGAELAAV